MDTAIVDGDFLKDKRGYPVKIEGLEEILQQVIIRLLTKKDSFIYDRNLGSRLSDLKSSYKDNQSLTNQALELIREALRPMPFVEALDLSINATNYSERLELKLTLSVNGENTELEVKI